jgi:hypothetical protein
MVYTLSMGVAIHNHEAVLAHMSLSTTFSIPSMSNS